jgi:hypothetical protein
MIDNSGAAMNTDQELWLAKKTYDELSLQFRTTWDLYLKFYVMFVTLNVTAMGLTVQFVHSYQPRVIIAIAFVMENVLSAITAAVIARYSARMAARVKDVAALIAENTSPAAAIPLALADSPLPGVLGMWSGVANQVTHVEYSILWISVMLIDFSIVK